MTGFYLTLLSDSSMTTFPNNTQSSFTVRLDHPISIEKENWEVALVEMITPTQVMNISEGNNYFYLRFFNRIIAAQLGVESMNETCTEENCADYFLKIPKGNYSSPQHLVEEIQRIIDIRFGEALRRSNASIEMTYGNNSKRVKIFYNDPNVVRLIFPKLLAKKLGLNPKLIEKPIGNERHAFKYEVDLNTANNQLYVYSDIASYTYVGDITAPILRVVPFEVSRRSHHSHQEFANLHYVPVAKSFIDQVHISIKGDTGLDVPFITGKSLIKLHFRLKDN